MTQAIWVDTVEALVAVGDFAEAAQAAATLGGTAREPVTSALATRCHGILAAARGDGDVALAEFTAALDLLAPVSAMPVERGRTLLALGIAQRRLKQRGAARATLTGALAIFDTIEAPLWAVRARTELARINGRASASGDLTATEQRAADLVARGRSNREVAAELFLSVRAIESTLTKTYTKLGVQSRSELAARLRAQ